MRAWLGRHSQRAIRREPMRPVVEWLFHRITQQQASKARAVDEQVGFQITSVFQMDRTHIAALAITFDRSDPAFDTFYPAPLGNPAQMLSVQDRIKMIGIGKFAERIIRASDRQCKAIVASSGRRHKHVFPSRVIWRLRQLARKPPMVQLDHGIELTPNIAEGMHVAITLLAPVVKFNAQFERAVGLLQEGLFIDLAKAVEFLDRWDRGFPNANNPYRIAFNQSDLDLFRKRRCQHCRGHPAS